MSSSAKGFFSIFHCVSFCRSNYLFNSLLLLFVACDSFSNLLMLFQNGSGFEATDYCLYVQLSQLEPWGSGFPVSCFQHPLRWWRLSPKITYFALRQNFGKHASCRCFVPVASWQFSCFRDTWAIWKLQPLLGEKWAIRKERTRRQRKIGLIKNLW